MEADARHYQDQLHAQNQARLDRFECKMDRAIEAITEVGVVVKLIPEMQERIRLLESERDQRKGAIGALAFLSGLVGGALEVVIHHFIGR